MTLFKLLQHNIGKIVISLFIIFLLFYFQKTLFFPNKFVFGYLGDQVMLFFYKWWVDNYELLGGSSTFTYYLGYPFGYSLLLSFINQPILWQSYFLLSSLVGAIPAYNMFVALSFVLNFFIFYLSYSLYSRRKILFNVPEGYFLAFFFSLNTHLFLHAKNHLDLLQIWIIPLGFALYKHNIHKSILAGIFTGLSLVCFLAISNYYAYMLFVLIGLFTLLLLISKVLSSNLFLIRLFKSQRMDSCELSIKFIISSFIVMLLGSFFIMLPFIKPIYTNSGEPTQFDNFKRTSFDFVNFSSRPWYYFLPSTLNPFLGGISATVLQKISASDNYLTQHYFAEEHAGNYLGFVTIGIFVYALVKFYRDFDVKISLILILCFFILSLPPIITWNLHEVYLPSYILFKLFPMFRVLSRFSVVIYTLILFIAGNGIKDILQKNRFTHLLILIIFLFMHVMEMYIPPRVTDVSNPPAVYSYLGRVYPYQSVAVYPYDKNVAAMFWISIHKNRLMNPRDYINNEVGFSSKTFTQELLSSEGITEFIKTGGTNLVVFTDRLSQNDFNFLQNETRLKLVESFDDAYLFTLN